MKIFTLNDAKHVRKAAEENSLVGYASAIAEWPVRLQFAKLSLALRSGTVKTFQ